MFARIMSVGGWTLASRVTGFGRDVVTAAVLGAGPVADAFVVAFRLPNHFRAIFGEGAFNAAFIPTYASLKASAGAAAARLFAERILALVIAVQLAILGLALVFTPALVGALAPGLPPATFDLAVALTRITFPYLLLITVVTLVSAVLNANDRFWAAASAPVLLNLSLVAALLLAAWFPSAGHAAAWGVALAGVLELALVWLNARAAGIAPVPSVRGKADGIGTFFRLLGPAIVGSAGIQLALFADTIIASGLPTGALSALYYAERLYQLPLGVVGIAAGTVLLPELTRRLSGGDVAGAKAAQNRAIGLTLALSAPFAVAYLIIPDLILSALFERGAFDAAAVSRSGAVLAAYAIGLPAAVLMRSVTATFYARHDTTTPLWASLGSYALNIGLKVALIGPFGVVGLALATSAGAWCNVLVLYGIALGRAHTSPTRSFIIMIGAVAIGCGALAMALIHGRAPVAAWVTPLAGGLGALATLAVLAATGAVIYGVTVLGLMRTAGIKLGR